MSLVEQDHKEEQRSLLRCAEMFDRLGEATLFSKTDLEVEFHQIRVRAFDVENTAFNTKYGPFEYLVMPIRVCNAPPTFQSPMNRIFHDCVDLFSVVYINDLLESAKTRRTSCSTWILYCHGFRIKNCTSRHESANL